jgi:hypothetical protein
MVTKTSMNAMACAIILAFGIASPTVARSESVGTSCADCPSYKGAFSLENTTGVTVKYQVKWGSSRQWKSMTLESGKIMTHSYPLDDAGQAPVPYVRFDKIGGDSSYTAQEYEMDFRKVGYAGYGARPNTSGPKPYVFRYAANGRSLDIKAK